MTSLFPADLYADAEALLAELQRHALLIVTAESCTGGLLAGLLTEVPGSSGMVERGFVTYSNAAKTELLGVRAELIERYGAVSEPVARAMAEGALAHARADIAVSVTGIAGPGGGGVEKPVGLVHFGAALRGSDGTLHRVEHFGDPGRRAIRMASVETAFELLRACAGLRR